MQLPAIIAKLRALLLAPIENEEQLLSLLVNTRKALDAEPGGVPGFSTLRFHCDWMVHHALSGRGAAKLIGHVDHYQDVIVDNSMQENPAPLDAAAFTARRKWMTSCISGAFARNSGLFCNGINCRKTPLLMIGGRSF
jgi:hypothetical protein